MEHRDYNYYEENAATINLGKITSSARNAKILRRLRDGDADLSHLSLDRDREACDNVYIGQGDDLGWLGYFIGRSEHLQHLKICYLPDGEEGHAFSECIARSQSIRGICINNLSNDGFTSIVRALGSLSQLEELKVWGNNNIGPDGWSEIGTLLDSGVCKLKALCLCGNNYIGSNEGVDILSNGLRGIGSSLKELLLVNNSIGNEGLSTLVDALQTCTGLESLVLSGNDFSSAAAELDSLSDWLQGDEVNLKHLGLACCRIIHCPKLNLYGNDSITATGLSYLSNSIRSDSCRVESLDLECIPIGDEGLEVLALGLAGNKSVRSLYLGDLDNDISVNSAGWLAFSKALCDTSSVNSTYLSNHTICKFRVVCRGGGGETILPRDISRYLRLHKKHPQYAARCKILMKHQRLNMTPFLRWGLKFLPFAVAWLERAKQCTMLTIYDANSASRRRVLEESCEAFESRKLAAMFEFVRGMPLEVMKSRNGLALAAA
eukprot:scaffold1336_cov100-Skeletonema_dohrnii-CCMP3373.AAC.4